MSTNGLGGFPLDIARKSEKRTTAGNGHSPRDAAAGPEQLALWSENLTSAVGYIAPPRSSVREPFHRVHKEHRE